MAASSSGAGAPEEEEGAVPKCHLHKKANKACKYCKAYQTFQEDRKKVIEEKKNEALQQLKESSRPGYGGSGAVDLNAKVPLPNLSTYPAFLKERINNTRFFRNELELADVDVLEVKEMLERCDSCEPEAKQLNSLEASSFFSLIYRLLTCKKKPVTEGQLRGLMQDRSCFVRSAGALFVRMAVQPERYWELLGDYLMDEEEFVPWPTRGGEWISFGNFVEQLLAKDTYCDFKLPRIQAALKKQVAERLTRYEQFRRRYQANKAVLDRFEDLDGGVPVEICRADGNWVRAVTCGPVDDEHWGRKCLAVPVRLVEEGGPGRGGLEEFVSLGMVICPSSSEETPESFAPRWIPAQQQGYGTPAFPSSALDLTRSRGRSSEELLDEFRQVQKEAAVLSVGNSGYNGNWHATARATGEKKRKWQGGAGAGDDWEEDSDEELTAAARESMARRKTEEERAKMAAIMEKYCSTATAASAKARGNDAEVDRAETMRLG